MVELGISDLSIYRDYLSKERDEWEILDSLLYITISRFYRNTGVFNLLREEILPLLVRRAIEEERGVRCWSAGCCSGEEPYTLQIIWNLAVMPELKSPLRLKVTATDRTRSMLERAAEGIYSESSVRDLPPEFLRAAFLKTDNGFKIKNHLKTDVDFLEQDIRFQTARGTFDLILCRNLVFTYFDDDLQRSIAGEIIGKLESGGFFIAGSNESIPDDLQRLSPYRMKGVYRRQ